MWAQGYQRILKYPLHLKVRRPARIMSTGLWLCVHSVLISQELIANTEEDDESRERLERASAVVKEACSDRIVPLSVT